MRNAISAMIDSFYDSFKPTFIIANKPAGPGMAKWYLDALARRDQEITVRYRLPGSDGRIGFDVTSEVKGVTPAPYATISSFTLKGLKEDRERVKRWVTDIRTSLGYELKK